jgi:hypothetical protein
MNKDISTATIIMLLHFIWATLAESEVNKGIAVIAGIAWMTLGIVTAIKNPN